MENHDFSDIRLDSNIKLYHYLPYLDGMDPELIDEYNKFILKRRFGFYQDQNSPNIYINDEKRLINDIDILDNYKTQFTELTEFINKIYYEFDIAYAEADYYQRPVYNTYKKMVLDNLNQESIRLNQIIERLDEYEVDNRQIYIYIYI